MFRTRSVSSFCHSGPVFGQFESGESSQPAGLRHGKSDSRHHELTMTPSIVDGERVAARSCHLEDEIPALRTALEESDVESAGDSVVRLRSRPGEMVFDDCELNGRSISVRAKRSAFRISLSEICATATNRGPVTGTLPISVGFDTTAIRQRSRSSSLRRLQSTTSAAETPEVHRSSACRSVTPSPRRT